MPLISVIIPVYNSAKYLPDCLNSVLGQTLQDLEIICINDGSTDNSLEILRKYARRDRRIKIINQKNMGVVSARNNGVAAAHGEYIYPLDSDDIIVPTALEKMYGAMTAGRGDIITYRVVGFSGAFTEMDMMRPTKMNMARRNCLVNAALMRRSDFIAAGGYSHDCDAALEDHELWMNMVFRQNKKIYRVPEMLFYYRFKPMAESRNSATRKLHKDLRRMMYNKYPHAKFWRVMYYITNPFRQTMRFLFRVQHGKVKIFTIPIARTPKPAKYRDNKFIQD